MMFCKYYEETCTKNPIFIIIHLYNIQPINKTICISVMSIRNECSCVNVVIRVIS